MDDVQISKLRSLQIKRNFAKTYMTDSQGGSRRGAEAAQALEELALSRRSDTLDFSHHLLKVRLTSELDQTIKGHVDKYPEMKDRLYIGIMVDGGFSAEVVSKDIAIGSVENVPREEAEKLMNENPVGYFSRKDFTLSTPDDPKYRELKEELDRYFERNQETLTYLRQVESSSQ